MFLEIIISLALISIAFVTLFGVGILAINTSASMKTETQADFLIKEEFEALRNFRDGTTWATNGLGFATTGIPYHLVNSSNKWSLVPGIETIGIFTRSVIFDAVYRDASGNIASSGTIDPWSLKATVTIAWQGRTMQVISYFTNWK